MDRSPDATRQLASRARRRVQGGQAPSELDVLRRRQLVEAFLAAARGGDFEGLLILTWDPKEKAYKAYVFGNDFPGAIVETGQLEGDTLVFRGEMAMGTAQPGTRRVTARSTRTA